MNNIRMPHPVIAISALIVMLAGCGGEVPDHGALSQSAIVGQPVSRLPHNSSGTLIYATGGCGGTCVFSYPQGQLVGSLPVGNSGACADSTGDVFISDDSEVVEYSHGGTTPIATFVLPGDSATGCSVDTTTGNIAVVFSGTGANVAIFRNGSGTPETYNSEIGTFYCGYDSQGNLFVDGLNGQNPALAELAKGGSSFLNISVGTSVGFPGQIQWDGKHITYEGVSKANATVSRLSVSGSSASVVSVTKFNIKKSSAQSWIYGNNIFIPYNNSGEVGHQTRIGIWKYPRGGKPQKVIKTAAQDRDETNFQGVAFSPTA